MKTLQLLGTLVLFIGFGLRAQVTDYDGNVYDTVTIGTQTWLASNLKVTHYQDGTPIPQVADSLTWAGLQSGARCYYNNDSAKYDSVYGTLYNYYAVVNTNKLCPAGWHVATDAEWTVMENYLGGSSVAGGPLKESGFTHWSSPNTGATNTTGFTGLPGGMRGITHIYQYIRENGCFWTASSSGSSAWMRYLYYLNAGVDRNPTPKKLGMNVRCIKDAGAGIGENVDGAKYHCYPNPTPGMVYLQYPGKKHLTLTVMNALGQVVASRQLQPGSDVLDISAFPAGMYLMQFNDPDSSFSQKLIKE